MIYDYYIIYIDVYYFEMYSLTNLIMNTLQYIVRYLCSTENGLGHNQAGGTVRSADHHWILFADIYSQQTSEFSDTVACVRQIDNKWVSRECI